MKRDATLLILRCLGAFLATFGACLLLAAATGCAARVGPDGSLEVGIGSGQTTSRQTAAQTADTYFAAPSEMLRAGQWESYRRWCIAEARKADARRRQGAAGIDPQAGVVKRAEDAFAEVGQ